MDKFKNKYRIQSARLKGWDYSDDGAYFITICTQNWQQFFGNVNNGGMQLSEIGEIAEKYWKEIPNHFPSILLDNFVVMPNHVHGVLIITETETLSNSQQKETLHSTSESTRPMTKSNYLTLRL